MLGLLEKEPYLRPANASEVAELLERTPFFRVDETPVPAEWLHGELIYDLIYNPRETALLRAARRQGLATLDGLQMFLGQAAQQFELFTGEQAPRQVMEKAALQALGVQAQERGHG